MNPKGYYPSRVREEPIKGLTAGRLLEVAEAVAERLRMSSRFCSGEGNYYYSGPQPEHYRVLANVAPPGQSQCRSRHRRRETLQIRRARGFREVADRLGVCRSEPFLSYLFEAAGDGSKTVREVAVSGLRAAPATLVEPQAIEWLAKGKVSVRAAMVDVLHGLKTERATEALTAHAKTEKTARIKAAINNALSTRGHGQ